MKRFRSFDELNIGGETAVTVGKFDGLHRGHKSIEHILRESGYRTVAVTFQTSPAEYIAKDGTGKGIVTRQERYMVMEDDGIESVLELPFDDAIMHMSAEAFVKNLVEKLHMKLFVCGDDFRFGYMGAGDILLLEKLAAEYDFELKVIKKIQSDEQDISSTRIRAELAQGNIKKVNELLGYPYFVYSEVTHGRGLGHKLGFATINQIPDTSKMLPLFGVYITRVKLKNGDCFGVTNVGVKPTVSDSQSAGIETHLLDYNGDLYEEFVKVEFLDYIREEKKFTDTDALTHQIEADEEYARGIISDGKLNE